MPKIIFPLTKGHPLNPMRSIPSCLTEEKQVRANVVISLSQKKTNIVMSLNISTFVGNTDTTKQIGYPDWCPRNKKHDETKPKVAGIDTSLCPILGLTNKQYKSFLKHFIESGNTSNENKTPMSCVKGKTSYNVEWIIDSGSTEHITHNKNILENRIETQNETLVVILFEDVIPVEGKEEYILPGWTKIRGILHIPKFTCNFLSISRLCQDIQSTIKIFPNFMLCRNSTRGT